MSHKTVRKLRAFRASARDFLRVHGASGEPILMPLQKAMIDKTLGALNGVKASIAQALDILPCEASDTSADLLPALGKKIRLEVESLEENVDESLQALTSMAF